MRTVLEVASPDSPESRAVLRGYITDVLTRVRRHAPAPHDVDAHLAADPSDHLRPPDGTFLLARNTSGVIGCAGLRYRGPDVPDGAAEVKRMFVRPAGRGREIGSLLLEHLVELARAAGRRRLVLDTRDELVEAIALYRRHGFIEVAAYNANPYSTSWWARDIRERGDG